MYISRWSRLWATLGARRTDATLFCDIVSKYREPHRKYHTLRHLEECLTHLDGARHLTERPAEIELALWFHDAIYAVRRQDNEERSAEWARTSAVAASLPAEVCERVRDLVLATRHNAAPEGADAALLVDIDLAILGASPQRFDEYEEAIREEYNWVPRMVFDIKRRAVLNGFRRRGPIFRTAHFAERFERQAQENLERSLAGATRLAAART